MSFKETNQLVITFTVIRQYSLSSLDRKWDHAESCSQQEHRFDFDIYKSNLDKIGNLTLQKDTKRRLVTVAYALYMSQTVRYLTTVIRLGAIFLHYFIRLKKKTVRKMRGRRGGDGMK
jgi:hypothetical protein